MRWKFTLGRKAKRASVPAMLESLPAGSTLRREIQASAADNVSETVSCGSAGGAEGDGGIARTTCASECPARNPPKCLVGSSGWLRQLSGKTATDPAGSSKVCSWQRGTVELCEMKTAAEPNDKTINGSPAGTSWTMEFSLQSGGSNRLAFTSALTIQVFNVSWSELLLPRDAVKDEQHTGTVYKLQLLGDSSISEWLVATEAELYKWMAYIRVVIAKVNGHDYCGSIYPVDVRSGWVDRTGTMLWIFWYDHEAPEHRGEASAAISLIDPLEKKVLWQQDIASFAAFGHAVSADDAWFEVVGKGRMQLRTEHKAPMFSFLTSHLSTAFRVTESGDEEVFTVVRPPLGVAAAVRHDDDDDDDAQGYATVSTGDVATPGARTSSTSSKRSVDSLSQVQGTAAAPAARRPAVSPPTTPPPPPPPPPAVAPPPPATPPPPPAAAQTVVLGTPTPAAPLPTPPRMASRPPEPLPRDSWRNSGGSSGNSSPRPLSPDSMTAESSWCRKDSDAPLPDSSSAQAAEGGTPSQLVRRKSSSPSLTSIGMGPPPNSPAPSPRPQRRLTSTGDPATASSDCDRATRSDARKNNMTITIHGTSLLQIYLPQKLAGSSSPPVPPRPSRRSSTCTEPDGPLLATGLAGPTEESSSLAGMKLATLNRGLRASEDNLAASERHSWGSDGLSSSAFTTRDRRGNAKQRKNRQMSRSCESLHDVVSDSAECDGRERAGPNTSAHPAAHRSMSRQKSFSTDGGLDSAHASAACSGRPFAAPLAGPGRSVPSGRSTTPLPPLPSPAGHASSDLKQSAGRSQHVVRRECPPGTNHYEVEDGDEDFRAMRVSAGADDAAGDVEATYADVPPHGGYIQVDDTRASLDAHKLTTNAAKPGSASKGHASLPDIEVEEGGYIIIDTDRDARGAARGGVPALRSKPPVAARPAMARQSCTTGAPPKMSSRHLPPSPPEQDSLYEVPYEQVLVSSPHKGKSEDMYYVLPNTPMPGTIRPTMNVLPRLDRRKPS